MERCNVTSRADIRPDAFSQEEEQMDRLLNSD
jgi:hypothetical protein